MQTAIVTGAAGGLGKAVVKALLEAKYHVIALDINLEGLQKLETHANLEVHQCDITNHTHVKELPKVLQLEKEGLDALICLAGAYGAFPVTENDPAFFERIMAVNFHSNVSLVNTMLKPLIKKKGRVVIVSSESHKIQAMFQPYMISKAALEAYARTAWQELVLKGVWLSIIRPGAIDTPLLSWMYEDEPGNEGSVYQKEFSASLKQSKKMVGRITTPEKVAAKVLHAATSRWPKRVYRVNNNLLLTLVTLLPPRVIDRMIVRQFRQKAK
jgi:NAD(P)-dependent dehydrogenase (short-subunit alcohol dehydrogenase family)